MVVGVTVEAIAQVLVLEVVETHVLHNVHLLVQVHAMGVVAINVLPVVLPVALTLVQENVRGDVRVAVLGLAKQCVQGAVFGIIAVILNLGKYDAVLK